MGRPLVHLVGTRVLWTEQEWHRAGGVSLQRPRLMALRELSDGRLAVLTVGGRGQDGAPASVTAEGPNEHGRQPGWLSEIAGTRTNIDVIDVSTGRLFTSTVVDGLLSAFLNDTLAMGPSIDNHGNMVVRVISWRMLTASTDTTT
jgi:hypothetical protein